MCLLSHGHSCWDWFLIMDFCCRRLRCHILIRRILMYTRDLMSAGGSSMPWIRLIISMSIWAKNWIRKAMRPVRSMWKANKH